MLQTSAIEFTTTPVYLLRSYAGIGRNFVFSGILVTGHKRITIHIVHTYHSVNVGAITICSATSTSTLRIRLTSRTCYVNNPHLTRDCLGSSTILAYTIGSKTGTVRPNCNFFSRGTDFIHSYSGCNLTFINPSTGIVSDVNSGSTTHQATTTTNIPVIPNYSLLGDPRRTATRTRHVNYPILVGTHTNNNNHNVHGIRHIRSTTGTFVRTHTRNRTIFNSNRYCVRGFITPTRRIRIRVVTSGRNRIFSLNRHRYSIRHHGRGLVRRDPTPYLSKRSSVHTHVRGTTHSLTHTINCRKTNAVRFLCSSSNGFCFVRVGAHLRIRRPIARFIASASLIG